MVEAMFNGFTKEEENFYKISVEKGTLFYYLLLYYLLIT